MKKIASFVIIFVLSLYVCSFAGTIAIKSGKTVEGEITERTYEHIKVNMDGIPLTYFLDDIESIDGKEINTSAEILNSNSGKSIEAINQDAVLLFIERVKTILPTEWKILSHEKGKVRPINRPEGEGQAIFLNLKNNEDFGKSPGIAIWIMDEAYGFPDAYDNPMAQAMPSQIFGRCLRHPIFTWSSAGKSWESWEEDIIEAFGEGFKSIEEIRLENGKVYRK